MTLAYIRYVDKSRVNSTTVWHRLPISYCILWCVFFISPIVTYNELSIFLLIKSSTTFYEVSTSLACLSFQWAKCKRWNINCL